MSQPNKHIVYQSIGQQRIDEFLWNEGGIVIIGGLMLAVFVGAIIYGKIIESVNRYRRRNRPWSRFR